MNTIYTIGHSNHSVEHFISMLRSFDISVLADVRSFPGSRWLPHFNKPALQAALSGQGIIYHHLPQLGGKRDALPGQAFPRSYTSYMETEAFKEGIALLENLAKANLAYMCAEASWRNCHRRYISAYLAARGWQVVHITGVATSENHVTDPPKPQQGSLFGNSL